MPYLEHQGDIAILHFGESQHTAGIDPENRFHPDWIARFHALLDEVEAHDGPRALVTTGAGKYYSTGADLRWVAEHPDAVDGYLSEIQLLFARLLVAPLPTVAALQGHTFGAGAFLALAHDRAVMRADRGYFCLPGISIGAAYAPGTVALVAARLAPRAAHEAMVSGRRYGGVQALSLGLVDEAVAENEVLSAAVEYAKNVAHTRGPVLGDIKYRLYEEAVTRLRMPVAGYNNTDVSSCG